MLNKETIGKLKEPLPPEAISPHPTKPYLSTIKVIYIVERLNEVFGIGGWKVTNEFVERVDRMVVVKAKFEADGIYVEAYGGNDNSDLGDAYKGACTDALSKIGSYLYIGMDVYKGLETAPVDSSRTLKTAREPIMMPRGVGASQPRSGSVLCQHDLPAVKHFVKKEGPNKGRAFYACAEPKANQCDFFLWESDLNKQDDDTAYDMDDVNAELGTIKQDE